MAYPTSSPPIIDMKITKLLVKNPENISKKMNIINPIVNAVILKYAARLIIANIAIGAK